ncbi:hypothetical protein PIB30_000231 [Stylosanthes scabra]|uniref:Uncharacterized protein n=1 Tax=Stylosanthes scabra TaxID=79078 RepID=A0ABU6S2K4_9FABA|nr:hypothetical protein [Stylosanthes scabra]
MPIMDQRNLFSFENPRLRFSEGQQQQQHLNNNKPVNLLHGIPTNMEPKQLASLHQSSQPLGNLNVRVNAPSTQSNPLLMQMVQSQPRGHMLSENTGPHLPRLPSSLGQPSASNGTSNGLMGRNGIARSTRAPGYNPVPQSSSMMNFPINQTTEMPISGFPLGSTPGISSITTKGSFQEEVTSGIKVTGGFVPNYDIFSELQKPHDWEVTNPGLTYNAASQHANSLHGNIDVSPSVLVQQSFSSNQQTGQSRDANTMTGKPMFSVSESMEQGTFQNQHLNTLVADNSIRVKTERVPDASSQSNFYPEHYGQEDLMSALLKQQEGIGQAENEFDFDGYSLDNVPV